MVVVTATAPDGTGAEDVTCFLDSVSINYGRDDADAQPDAATATLELSWDTATDALPGTVDVGSRITVTAYPTGLAEPGYVRFVGAVTDATLGWDDQGEDTPEAAIGQVIAAAPLGDLSRRIVGDTPWAQQLDGARVAAILAAAEYPADPAQVDPGTVAILARDVDAQSALELAQGVAADAGGIVWHDRAGVIRYADAVHRVNTAIAVTLDACDLLVSPQWVRNTGGLVNKVSIAYGPTPEDGEQPTYAAQNAASVAQRGRYEYSASTQLAALADAQAMAQLLLVRNAEPVWIMSALPVDTADLDLERTAVLLGLDMHSLIALTGLPSIGHAPTSAALWVEGWRETWTADAWDLELWVTGYCRTSPPPTWDRVPNTVTWANVADTYGDITWDDATCLGPLPSQGRWADVPATLRWDKVPAATAWDTWKG